MANSTKKLRILHTPTDVGGNPQGIARAERQLGYQSESVVFADSIFRYAGKTLLFKSTDGFLKREIRRYSFFFKALFKFDVFHFNFGQSIFPSELSDTSASWEPYVLEKCFRKMRKLYARILSLKDLFWLRLIGKKIFITFQGDDARQASYCQAHFPIHFVRDVTPDYYPPWLERLKPKRIAKFAKYAHKIYAVNPDLLWILPAGAEFVPYCHIDLNDWIPVHRRIPADKKLHLIHAPSDRHAKGTKYLLAAITKLREQGFEFEFTLVEKFANQDARKLYEQADILIDQLLAGWYGGLAVELMALGKPVVCYIRESDLVHIPEEMRKDLPVVNADPFSIFEILRNLLEMDTKELSHLGEISRRYVEKWHDPLKIADRFLNDYQS